MIDPLSILDDLCAGLGADDASPVPGVPGAVPGRETQQLIDINNISRHSRHSRSENGVSGKNEAENPNNDVLRPGGSRVTSSYVEMPGTPGTEVKSLAETTSLPFPVKVIEPGTPGTGSDPCGRPFLDLNQAAPQRPEWLSDATVAALAPQLVPAPPPGDPLPISASDVWAGIDRETRQLGADGLDAAEARRRAVEITVAKIRNAPALVERQLADGRCHICRGPLDDSRPEVAVMQGKPGSPLHMHADCHAEHKRRRTELVDRIMAAADIGTDRMGGEA